MSPNFTPRSERLPDTRQALSALVDEARRRFPFHRPTAELCAGPCTGCPKKLLELSELLLSEWEDKLALQYQPKLGELQRLSKQLHKLATAFERNQLLSSP